MQITSLDLNNRRALQAVLWLQWGFSLAALLALSHFFGPKNPVVPAGENPLLRLIGFAPIFISIVLRWLMYPHAATEMRAFVLSVVGVAMAEVGGLLGVFFGGPFTEHIFILGVLGILQFTPWLTRRSFGPKPQGFHVRN